ncbi:unnamed protein product [Paramecium octaurelia]|uniref:Uncharacterized protein n=1 Tax=Paramecium octaurelia TaxID=43137 RepID=A0A8S1XHJ2_PAROT|nr:unnamed protein product [Paramecium octaurelia]
MRVGVGTRKTMMVERLLNSLEGQRQFEIRMKIQIILIKLFYEKLIRRLLILKDENIDLFYLRAIKKMIVSLLQFKRDN